jgi:hypothetical protein
LRVKGFKEKMDFTDVNIKRRKEKKESLSNTKNVMCGLKEQKVGISPGNNRRKDC